MTIILTADRAWLNAYESAILGARVSPRGKETFEQLHVTHKIDLRYPVVTVKERKLGYHGMAAEAWWILTGSDLLADIEPWLPRMREFSDNGVILAGAYGPRVFGQMDYVVDALRHDHDTRQATLTTWQPNPPPSKDIPCTVAMDFKLRDGKLNTSVFMRSSDVWLGLPYDIFSFAMITYMVIVQLRPTYPLLAPGMLWITAASSHVYVKDTEAVLPSRAITPKPAPEALWSSDVHYLLDYLDTLRETRSGDNRRWWER